MAASVGEHRASASGSWWRRRAWLALALAGIVAACGGGGSGSENALGGPAFTYTGPSTWTVTGLVGGPFANDHITVTLANPGNLPVNWSATSVPSYVQLDLLGGTLAAGTRVDVHASLITAVAQGLGAGNTPGTLTFHNDDGTQPDVDVDCDLSIGTGASSLQVLPTTDFATQGPALGPFSPDSTVYSITNTGSAALDWQVISADAWISISPASGQLAVNASIDVTVSINDPATASLPEGLQQSEIDFEDAADGTVLDTRHVDLIVSPDSASNGWTVFTPSPDTQFVYVSSSTGNDGNDGLSVNTPKRTIGAGKAMMRNGFPDWLLLKKGDVWNETIGDWSPSGRSITERMLISSYGSGTTRPLLRTGTSTGFITAYQATPNHVALVGIEMVPHLYNGTNNSGYDPFGVQWLRDSSNLLIEDCYFHGFVQGMSLAGNNISIRRNVIADSNCQDPAIHSQGLGCGATNGLLLEDNVLINNGWGINGAPETQFRHNEYINVDVTGVVQRGNIVIGTDGVQFRAGGLFEDNLIVGTVNALNFGGGSIAWPAGVSGSIRRNVILDGQDSNGGLGAWGIKMVNINSSGVAVEDNIMANSSASGTFGRPFQLLADDSFAQLHNVALRNNIVYGWRVDSGGCTIAVSGAAGSALSGLVLDSNSIDDTLTSGTLMRLSSTALLGQITSTNNAWLRPNGAPSALFFNGSSNRTFAQMMSDLSDATSTNSVPSYPAPTRSLGSYAGTLGIPATQAAFVAQERLQSKDNWRTEYTAGAVISYIRAGFGL